LTSGHTAAFDGQSTADHLRWGNESSGRRTVHINGFIGLIVCTRNFFNRLSGIHSGSSVVRLLGRAPRYLLANSETLDATDLKNFGPLSLSMPAGET